MENVCYVVKIIKIVSVIQNYLSINHLLRLIYFLMGNIDKLWMRKEYNDMGDSWILEAGVWICLILLLELLTGGFGSDDDNKPTKPHNT